MACLCKRMVYARSSIYLKSRTTYGHMYIRVYVYKSFTLTAYCVTSNGINLEVYTCPPSNWSRAMKKRWITIPISDHIFDILPRRSKRYAFSCFVSIRIFSSTNSTSLILLLLIILMFLCGYNKIELFNGKSV